LDGKQIGKLIVWTSGVTIPFDAADTVDDNKNPKRHLVYAQQTYVS